MWMLWNGYPQSSMPFIAKFFAIVQISYYLQALLYNATIKAPEEATCPSLKQSLFHLAMHFIAGGLASNSLIPMLIAIMIPHTLLSLIDALHRICISIVPDNEVLHASLGAIFKYMTLVEYVYLSVMSVLMCCWGEANPIVLRLFLVIVALCYSIWGVLTFYFEEQEAANRPNAVGARRVTPVRKPKGMSNTRLRDCK